MVDISSGERAAGTPCADSLLVDATDSGGMPTLVPDGRRVYCGIASAGGTDTESSS